MAAAQTSPSRSIKQQSADILTQWESGTLTYQEAIGQLIALKGEVSHEGRLEDEAFLESRIGVIEGYRGNYATGIAHFERARDLYLSANDPRQVVTCNLNIGETYRLKGNFSRALQYFRIGYEAALELGDRELQVMARANESQMMMSQGHVTQAEETLRECYGLCETPFPVPAGSTPESIARAQLDQRADITQALTSIYLKQGRIDDAWHFAKESYLLATELGTDLRLGFAYRALAEVITDLPTASGADFESDPDIYFTDSVARFKAVNAEGEMARTLYAQGCSLGKRGRSTLAARKLHQAMIIFSRLGMVDDAARAAEEQLRLM